MHPLKHFCLLASGYNPKHAPRSIDRRIGHRHAVPALTVSGQCPVRAADIEHSVSRNQRGSVSIRAETEVDEVENRWGSGDLLESRCVLRNRGLQIGGFNRHGMDRLRPQRGMLQQAFAQVSKVPIRISFRGYSFIDLIYMRTSPWNVLGCQRPQHDPGSVTHADSHGKTVTGSNRGPSISADHSRSYSRHQIGIIKHFALHRNLPYYATPALSAGLARNAEILLIRSRRVMPASGG